MTTRVGFNETITFKGNISSSFRVLILLFCNELTDEGD